MRIALALFALALFVGCEQSCPGYEKVTVGSGCRDAKTGEFVNLAHCEEC